MSSDINESVECSECGFVFQGNEVGKHPREHEPCPNCGSLRRHVRVSVKETWGLSEYTGIKAKKQGSEHKNKRADYEFGEGKKKGGDGKLVYKRMVRDREHPNSPGSYIEYVRDKDGNIIVNKSEKLSEHTSSSKNK